MVFIFDKGTSAEKEIEMSYFNERPAEDRLNANNVMVVEEGQDFPTIPTIGTFTTIECVNNKGIVIPLIGSYSEVEQLDVSYDEDTNVYSVHMVIK